MTNKSCYNLTSSQDVAYMQCKFSLYKRVINILSSITMDEEVDFELMDQAFKLLVERNDCLRIRFFKKKGKLMQYFSDSGSNIKKVPVLSFETKEQQDAFIDKVRKKPLTICTALSSNLILFTPMTIVTWYFLRFVI